MFSRFQDHEQAGRVRHHLNQLRDGVQYSVVPFETGWAIQVENGVGVKGLCFIPQKIIAAAGGN